MDEIQTHLKNSSLRQASQNLPLKKILNQDPQAVTSYQETLTIQIQKPSSPHSSSSKQQLNA